MALTPLPTDSPADLRARRLRFEGKLPLAFNPLRIAEELVAYDATLPRGCPLLVGRARAGA